MRQLILTVLLLCSTAIYADIKRPDSYNYTRGLEAIQNDNTEEALDYFNKEIAEHPDNGYVYAWIAFIRLTDEEYGPALTASNVAVKKIPAKDKEYRAFAFNTRAKIYLNLQDTVLAIKDYGQAISATPDDDDLYKERAQVYYEQGKYALADEDYRKMIALDEGNVVGYIGLGRNANAQKKYEDAIKQFDYVNKLAPTYSSAYSFRAESYMGLGKYNEAVDDVIKALAIDYDDQAFSLMQQLADSAFDYTVAKLKIQKISQPKDDKWSYCLGVVYEISEKYSSALSYYKESMALDPSSVTASRMAICCDKIGDYDKAVDYCNQALSMDSTQFAELYRKALYLDHAGRPEEAIKAMDSYVAYNPGYCVSYAMRASFKVETEDNDGALEDFTTAITLYPDYAYAYLNRGVLYKRRGDTNAAYEDFKQVVRIDSVQNSGNLYYAYYFLGNKEKAIESLNKALDDDEKVNSYNAACIYSLMGEKGKSIFYLRKALEYGYRNFARIKCDRDFENVRNTPEFEALIKEYEKKHQMEISSDEEDDDSAYETKVEEVPFTKEGGVCKVKCSINGLPLHFIFDTGASDVSISSVEATFMAKNDYLSASDIIGKQNYMTADGSISEGTVVTLRDVKLGSLHLENVRASVSRNQTAPLLLGQSVLSKLGKIEIDNTKKVLRITHKQKMK